MRITKYLHSCLLIEESDTVILLDPGEYTYHATILPLATLPRLDYILITHEHADHFSVAFLKEILVKFPEVTIVSNPSVVSLLEQDSIPASNQGNDFLTLTQVPHEEILFAPTPENIQFTLFNKLTHPGDSFHFSSSVDIVAMPMTAPWGSLVAAMKKVIELKPKIVIPIHDWHLKNEAIDMFYPRVTELFKKQGITFLALKTGKAVDL